ncbi:DUF3867 domain-containing protein [Clostridium polynesiense]|uniref:DUF3867 domain-containing protein n=1 Tax=Clostridium polynesiense TaxID=1325933 RepID=UPI00058DA6D0|nr:DUF3867 domain-containing protein [Clostridium polynesiense]
MSDIIDFNELKNKANEKDVDKFEQYIYGLYYSMSSGDITMAEVSNKIREYMEHNNISEEKLFNIQKKLMDRYGVDMDSLNNQMKNFGIDMDKLGIDPKSPNYEAFRKSASFYEKYKERIAAKSFTTYTIKNSVNELEILIAESDIILKSYKNIDLKDVELNEFLVSYKKVINNKELTITICENTSTYQY